MGPAACPAGCVALSLLHCAHRVPSACAHPRALLQARWLVGLLARGPEAAKEAFSLIPESVVRDMTSWLT